MSVLGTGMGFLFLVANLPINWCAGFILSLAADRIEQRDDVVDCANLLNTEGTMTNENVTTRLVTESKKNSYDALIVPSCANDDSQTENKLKINFYNRSNDFGAETFDFVGMTSATFNNQKTTRLVMLLYYLNIFLVLGNYIVVMSHAVVAFLNDDVNDDGIFSCTPVAGLLASTLMFAVSQLRTMARLGRTASLLSLLSLGVVVAQCLYFSRLDLEAKNDVEEYDDEVGGLRLLLRQFSALGSIGFAVGSQKLFLNIRHEFTDRKEAPKSLAVALTVFGSVYVFIIAMAGDNPPGFLFDAIPRGSLNRQVAGFFLWVHVAVSYAINSQALCSSMDRNFFSFWDPMRRWTDTSRWTALTAIMASTAFFIANAIPFFKDLVAFCGALTSVPLTLLLPAVFYRRTCEKVQVWCPEITFDSLHPNRSWASYLLLVYSCVFMIVATLGSIYSIQSDWKQHPGGFFSCR